LGASAIHRRRYHVKHFEAEALALLDQFELAPKRNALAGELSAACGKRSRSAAPTCTIPGDSL